MKFTYGAKAFPASKGDHFVVCVKNGEQRSAVALFNTEGNAIEDADDRNQRAATLGVEARYQVCPRADGSPVHEKVKAS